MTAYTHGVVVARPRFDQRGFLQIRDFDVSRSNLNRPITSHGEKGMDCREVRIISADIHQTEIGCAQYRSTSDSTGPKQRCNCFFMLEFSEPHPDTGNEACLINISTLVSDEVSGVAVGAAPGNAYVWSKLADNFIP